MDLGGDLGAVVRASRQDCSHAPCSNLKIDGLEIDSYNLLNSAAVLDSCMKEVPISISISNSNSNTVTYSPFYDCKGTARSQSLSPSMFESLELYNHPVVQKAAAWSYATAESSLSGAEGKAEKNDQDHDLIMATDSTSNEEEASGPIRFAVVCPSPTLTSSPPRSVHVKSPPRSPTRHDDLSAKTPDREADCSPSSPITTDSIAENKTIALVTKRRKIQQRRTVCIPATEGSWNKPGGGGVPSDLWAWRKYGQKPIKGSPYPRGYYRCSSCKGCPARKQVERSHTDPTKLVITYTADHNHAWPTSHPRNGLALRESSASTHKDMIALVVPHSPQKSDVNTAQGPNPVSPTTDIEQEKPRSQAAIDSLDFNLMETADSVVEDHDQTAGLHMLRSNHMHYDDLFADLGELKDFARYFADYKSDEETGSTIVDPYNLFNW